ncbi:Ni/Fe-hydrogenase cytochrome b subunit [bacterium]|nr:MAG: Ni/Fe-hydrogenase cytochrome b subunit [bacterium]
MEIAMKPVPVSRNYFTPGVIVLLILALNGLVFLAGRFIFGLGAVTNLDNSYPWGIWIGIDVAAGVALAAGGFTTAALGHLMHRESYNVVVRPALLTAMLGYTFVAFGVFIDIGRYYYLWHPLVMWNGNSALFEVGICVTIYVNVLYIEFLPIVTERFIGKVNLRGPLARLNRAVESLLRVMDRTLSKTMFIFIIAGVVLSCLHQSSLGTMMVIAGQKMHPLWQTPILPLLFLLSAIAVGFPMVIFESLLASRSLGLKPEMHVLSRLGRFIVPTLGIYLAFKIGDMVIRETHVYLMEFTTESVMYALEIVLGVIIPLRLALSRAVLNSPLGLFVTSSLVILGVLLNRINNFIVAYTPPYATHTYYPSFGELSVTIGCAAILVLLYRAFVLNFPIISLPDKRTARRAKYSIQGTSA